MMPPKSKSTWALALAAAMVTSTNAINCVGNGRTALTATTAALLCPNYASDPHVKIKHAWVDPETGKGGHCGGKKTEELQLSIANGLFGGNTAGDRDCTAWCVKNSEGGGHFKFDHKRECFKFRGTGMCGTGKEKTFAKDAKAQLCDETAVVLDDATCRNMDSDFLYPTLATLSNDYEVSYSVTLNSINEQNVFLGAKTPSRYVYWNNYIKPGSFSGETQNGQLCLDSYCQAWTFTEPMNIGQQYEFSFQYHDGVAHASRCSNGANCISETNMAVTQQMLGQGATPFSSVTFKLNFGSRGADGTLCNLQVRDFRQDRRRAVQPNAKDSIDDIKTSFKRSEEDRHCPACP